MVLGEAARHKERLRDVRRGCESLIKVRWAFGKVWNERLACPLQITHILSRKVKRILRKSLIRQRIERKKKEKRRKKGKSAS